MSLDIGQHRMAPDSERRGWKSVVSDMVDGTVRAVRRFPVVAALLALITFEVNSDISEWWLLDLWEHDNTFPLAAAVVAALAVSLALETRAIRDGTRAMFAALAGFVAFLMVDWRVVVDLYEPTFTAALLGLVFVAPFLWRGSSLGFWLFVVRCLFAGLLAVLAVVLFAGGFSAILASLTYLFGIEIPEVVYGHVWATASLLAGPLFGLGQLPEEFGDTFGEATPAYVRKGMQVLGDYVAAPLLLIYAIMLHIYAATILISGDWPEGQVGWLVLTFGICLIAVLMVIHPFLTLARPPTRLLITSWPFLLPVPVLLLFLAAGERIAEYGVTPERYLLVLFGIAAATVLACQLRPRLRGDIRVMAAVPVAALLLTSFGPHGAVAVSVRSQADRFMALTADPPFSPEENAEAMTVLDYLAVAGGLDAVRPETLPPASEAGYGLFRRIAVAYDLDPDLRRAGETRQFSKSFQLPGALATDGFDIVLTDFALYHEAAARNWPLPGGAQISVTLRDNAIVIGQGEDTVTFPLQPATVDRLIAADETDVAPLVLNAGARRAALYPSYLAFRSDGGSDLINIAGIFLLRAADWPVASAAEPGEGAGQNQAE